LRIGHFAHSSHIYPGIHGGIRLETYRLSGVSSPKELLAGLAQSYRTRPTGRHQPVMWEGNHRFWSKGVNELSATVPVAGLAHLLLQNPRRRFAETSRHANHVRGNPGIWNGCVCAGADADANREGPSHALLQLQSLLVR
jgi:hypothetical protein